MPNTEPAPNFLLDAITRIGKEVDADRAVTPVAPSPDQLLSTKHLAALLSLSPRTLDSWRGERKGPPVTKVGGMVRYRYRDVIDWLRRENPDT